MDERDWGANFSRIFSTPASPVQDAIWTEVFADEYPSGLATFSYVTNSLLNRFVEELGLGADHVLADLGCGRGGPGLWVAARTGARLIGIDIADTAVSDARRRAANAGMGSTTEFRVGTFEATGLEGSTLDGVMSVDALIFTPDKRAAIAEMARILKPGGRLALTTWDYHTQPLGRPPQVPDHRPLFEAAGFHVRIYDETPGWRSLQSETTRLSLARVADLAAETGTDIATLRERLQEMAATQECMTRHASVVADLP
jgi:SAM-dependent methyltransferase